VQPSIKHGVCDRSRDGDSYKMGETSYPEGGLYRNYIIFEFMNGLRISLMLKSLPKGDLERRCLLEDSVDGKKIIECLFWRTLWYAFFML